MTSGGRRPSRSDVIPRDHPAGLVYLQHLREDAVWHGTIAGEVRGRAAIAAFFQRLMATIEHWGFEVHDIVANEEHMVVLGRNDIRLKNGQALEGALSAEVYHLDDQGRIKDVWPMLDTEKWKKALGVVS
jgi:limonene-1,2-epoxide hydrolase